MTRTAAIYQQLGIIRNKKGKESNASITPRQDLAFHLLLNLYRLTGNVIFHVSCVSETSGTVGVDRMSDILTSLSFVSLTFGMFAFFPSYGLSIDLFISANMKNLLPFSYHNNQISKLY